MLMLVVVMAASLNMLFFYLLVQRLMGRETDIDVRLAQIEAAHQPQTTEELILKQSVIERLVKPLLEGIAVRVGRITPRGFHAKIQHSLALAGNPGGLRAAEFIGLVCLGVLAIAAITFSLTLMVGMTLSKAIFLTIWASLFGMLLPVLVLRRKIEERKQAVVRTLPDTLDLLTVSVEAGLGFDAAILKVTQQMKGPLAVEFAQMLHEIQVGKMRRESLRDMSERIAVADFTTFISAIIQADQLGVSIGNVLRIQAEQMRLRRRQRAEEMAMKAPIKMLIPMVIFIFPTIFVVLLGPAVIRMIDMFTQM